MSILILSEKSKLIFVIKIVERRGEWAVGHENVNKICDWRDSKMCLHKSFFMMKIQTKKLMGLGAIRLQFMKGKFNFVSCAEIEEVS